MKTQQERKSTNKNPVVDRSISNLQGGNIRTFQFKDNRPEAVLQQKAQELANEQNLTNVVHQKANNTGLPNQLKSGIENLSGYSMDDVKVHYNSPKPAQLHAHAYAQGTDIHIASGQEKHLPHEAWHVVQQKQGRVKPTMQLKGAVNINDDAGLEKEADVMGDKALNKIDIVQKYKSTIQLQAVIQRVYIEESTGFEISDEQYDHIDTLINHYDADVGDIDKGGDAPLTAAQIQIAVALTELKSYLVGLFPNLKVAARVLDNIRGQGGRFNGSLWAAIQEAETGRQCNNELSKWMRGCMSNFKKEADEEESKLDSK